MTTSIDTDTDLEVGWSWPKMVVILLSIVLSALLLALMLRSMISVGVWTSPILILLGAMTLFLFCTCLLGLLAYIWFLLAFPRAVLTFSPRGLRDQRWSPDTIPWSAIEKVSFRQLRAGSELLIRLRPESALALRRNAAGRLIRRSENWRPDYLMIATLGLAIRDPDLQAAAEAYLARYGASVAPV